MNEYFNDIRSKVEVAIRDLLSNKDVYNNIDLDEVVSMIQGFVILDVNINNINDGNRYESYYKILGKAVAIVQGWKINCIEDVKLPSETKESLKLYIENTYGKEIVSDNSQI